MEGIEICMIRVVKNFLDVDLDLLTDEPDEVGPSNAGAASPAVELAPRNVKPTTATPEPAIVAPRRTPDPDTVENVPTSSTVAPLEVKNF